MSRILFALPLLLAVAFAAAPSIAQETGLYEGEAAVDSQSAEHRAQALPRALAQVLVKVSGDPAIAAAAAQAGRLADAPNLMQRYRYRQDVVADYGVPTQRTVLIAQFDPAGVDGLVGRSGYAVWPSPRPRPLLWLAIDDGSGARLVGESQAAAVAALVKRGGERGLGFSFPSADLQDQTVGGAQAVWREDLAAVRSAASRYGSAPLLVGRMRRDGGGWAADWALLDGGATLARWASSDVQATAVLAAGADGAATALARNYTAEILSGPAGDYEVVIVGLASAEDYGRTLQYLQSLPIVQSLQVGHAMDDRLRVRLSLRSGLEGLARLLQRGGVLRAEPAAAGDAPAFRLER